MLIAKRLLRAQNEVWKLGTSQQGTDLALPGRKFCSRLALLFVVSLFLAFFYVLLSYPLDLSLFS